MLEEEINPFDIMSGLVARDEWGTYWFKEPGNNMLNAGMPIEKNLHRAGAPAIEWRNGRKDWYKDGERYRVIYSNGDQYWYKNGVPHSNNDLPAVIQSDGTQGWYKNGVLHRDNDLPALVDTNGNQFWYKNGNQHRDNNLPAAIWADGTQEWWVNGECI